MAGRGSQDVTRRQRRRASDRRRAQPLPVRRSLSGVTTRLLELGQRLRQTRDLDHILAAVTRIAVELTRSAQGTLRLLDDSGKRLLTSARFGPSVHRRGSPAFHFGEGFIGWVVAHGRSAYTNHPHSDPRFVKRPGQVWTPQALLAVPLFGERGCIGVLSVSRRRARPYRPLDLNLAELVGQLSEPQLEIARLKRLGESDPLTLLQNRRYLDEQLPLRLQQARARGEQLVLALLDIDHFKAVNDTHGHDAGDEVLCQFADRLRSCSRDSDVVVRWGGEEFVVLLNATSGAQARLVAERIRKEIAGRPFAIRTGNLSLTTSIGLAALQEEDDAARLLRRADQALYRAKHRGRNRVEVAG